jgi:hypothetical protein
LGNTGIARIRSDLRGVTDLAEKLTPSPMRSDQNAASIDHEGVANLPQISYE